MGLRPGWIATCALAVIGGFFLSLRVAWLVHLDADWLPYAAHVLGAAFAGGAMARQGPLGSRFEPIVGGILGVAILAVTALALPSAFGWIAMRSHEPWLVALAIAVASGAAAGGGAWLARGNPEGPGIGSTLLLATLTTACAVMLGGRIGVALGVPVDLLWVMVVASVAAFVAAFATQSVVPVKRLGACASGVAILFALQLLEWAVNGNGKLDAQVLALVIPLFGGILGARAAAGAR